MSKITELLVGRKTEVNENNETVVIDPGKKIIGKGSFFFTRKADELYKTEDANGNKIDGVTAIYSELTEYNDLGLIKFWNCALANHPQYNFTEGEIILAIQEVADKEGTQPLFAGALEVFTKGFYKGKIDNQDFMMTLAVQNEKDPQKKEELIGHMEMLKQMRAHQVNSLTTIN